MFGSTIIDIAIGIVFVFLLVSLFASTINEIILSYLNMRGRDLVRGLRELLSDKDGTGLVQHLYSHGLIYGLFQGDYVAGKTGNLPAYIPARSFALAIMDIIPKLGGDAAALGVRSGASGATSTKEASQTAENALEALRTAAEKLDPKVRAPLLAMIDASSNDASVLRQNLETWFNSTMDRVSGWYKYRTQYFLFWIGLVLAASMNIDSLVIARRLSTDSSLRQALVAAAADSARQPASQQSAGTAPATQGQQNTIPPGAPAPGSPGSQQVTQNSTLADVTTRIENLALPIGWTCDKAIALTQLHSIDGWRDAGSLIHRCYISPSPAHLGGWFLTALAASLGAPFWFDLLNKFMVVRSTVKPREKSHEEKSKGG